jgi:DNA-directed RNA polymerase subunit omega
MITSLKSDEFVNKVGGRFRFTALVQRRLKELIEGSRPLVEAQGKNMVEIAIAEIVEGKIAVDYDHTEDLALPDDVGSEPSARPRS